ncbi:MAG: hypothetical protein R6V75_05570 [Bacteroidales bacterium]
MHKFRMILPLLVVCSLLFSCDLINPPEKIPTYIKIDTMLVRVDDFDRGAATHQISNVFLTVENSLLGIFEMPFTVPCLSTGKQEVFIRPGIRLNGIAGSRVEYPFFKPYRDSVNLAEGEIITINPITTYKDECQFPWMEDFEDAGVSFIYSQYSDTTIRNQTSIVRTGRYSGAIYLDDNNRYFEATGPKDFVLPRNSATILLEFDYINDVEFELGMYVMEDGAAVWNSLLVVRENSNWKRFYADLHTTVAYNNNAEAFRIGFRAEYDTTRTGTQHIILDNVKLIHF